MAVSRVYIAKKVVTTAVGWGSSKIVHAIIVNNTNPIKTVDRMTIAAASMALGGMVADAATEYTDAKIEEFVEAVKKFMAGAQADPDGPIEGIIVQN